MDYTVGCSRHPHVPLSVTLRRLLKRPDFLSTGECVVMKQHTWEAAAHTHSLDKRLKHVRQWLTLGADLFQGGDALLHLRSGCARGCT
jgi:hypothetical protein